MAKKIFQRLFLTIILVLVIQIVRVILDKSSPMSILYHSSLLQALRLLLISWFFLTLVLDIIFRKSQKIKRTGLLATGVIVVLVSIGEMLSVNWMKHPEKIPGPVLQGYRLLYAHNLTNVVQILPECSEYDSCFYYNLKANNSCTFTNIEFSNPYTTNSKGFRDDDSSLHSPEVICLGDSYIMGWGVNQQEAVPAVLESMSGKRVLNAGMSSFGTAREVKRLGVLDTSAMKYLVVQYCPNDNEENKAWVDNGGKLPISSEASYDSLQGKNEWNKKYFPGKYFLIAMQYWGKEKIKSMLGRPPSVIGLPIEPARDAKMFLDIMKTAPVDFHKTKVLVFEAVELAYVNNVFINEVNKLLDEPAYKAHFAGNLVTVPLEGKLGKEDFYILDGHIRPSGHRKIASEIAKYLQ
jgi:hypothetical protein